MLNCHIRNKLTMLSAEGTAKYTCDNNIFMSEAAS